MLQPKSKACCRVADTISLMIVAAPEEIPRAAFLCRSDEVANGPARVEAAVKVEMAAAGGVLGHVEQ